MFGYKIINYRCECDLEDFYIRGGYCDIKPLEVSLSYEYNAITLYFSKQLANILTSSDLVITFLKNLIVDY
jgi:hypothetical protein